jgi:hypothetical protein
MLHSRLKIIQARAAQANKAALEAEKQRDELHTQIEEIEEQLQPKRVKREYLRHRKWYRIAFLQVTNDKKHDCWSSQAFACRRLEFYDIFHKKRLDEALKFALNDEAETERK